MSTRPVIHGISDWWCDPMPEDMARRVLGSAHFDWTVGQGAPSCAARAAGAWQANLQEYFGAYKAAERVAVRGAAPADEDNSQAYCEGWNAYGDGSVNHYPFGSREFCEFGQGLADAKDEAADRYEAAVAVSTPLRRSRGGSVIGADVDRRAGGANQAD
ncbi:hypothetical protein [Paraburkholderia antibiotica]|uniref:Uncharacterized protein n=1 Tax=Paraburkholderia antibiotica TaxID=2728839 RepID=A0A7X9ZX89_9BURK|nr:hypothetical protein [Paraburkholderia antibiotica]NML31807.1 hypothetical protein [Paraburkholderia antibiotica]